MAYLTLQELKAEALTQFLDDPNPPDAALAARITQAHSSVNGYLGIDTDLALAASSARTIYGSGTLSLPLPAHVGDVTLVAAPSGYTVPDYVEQDNELLITDSSGIILRPYVSGLSPYNWGATTTVWTYGVPWTVTASWGVSAGTLAILKSVTMDLAVQLWRYKDAGGSETIGAEGGITTVRSGLTPRMKDDLEHVRRRINGQSVGVW